jgi:predicted SnoaL-like aldol condensation-catalyzing enzyme
VRGDACRRPFVDPCHLREMPLSDLWRVKDGKFLEHWDEVNLLEVFQ